MCSGFRTLPAEIVCRGASRFGSTRYGNAPGRTAEFVVVGTCSGMGIWRWTGDVEIRIEATGLLGV
jgi:hypothetical protein